MSPCSWTAAKDQDTHGARACGGRGTRARRRRGARGPSPPVSSAQTGSEALTGEGRGGGGGRRPRAARAGAPVRASAGARRSGGRGRVVGGKLFEVMSSSWVLARTTRAAAGVSSGSRRTASASAAGRRGRAGVGPDRSRAGSPDDRRSMRLRRRGPRPCRELVESGPSSARQSHSARAPAQRRGRRNPVLGSAGPGRRRASWPRPALGPAVVPCASASGGGGGRRARGGRREPEQSGEPAARHRPEDPGPGRRSPSFGASYARLPPWARRDGTARQRASRGGTGMAPISGVVLATVLIMEAVPFLLVGSVCSLGLREVHTALAHRSARRAGRRIDRRSEARPVPPAGSRTARSCRSGTASCRGGARSTTPVWRSRTGAARGPRRAGGPRRCSTGSG